MRLPAQLALALGSAVIPSLVEARQVTPAAGHYLPSQAERGRRIFGAYCALCHGAELEGATGPALMGPAFLGKWNGGAGRTTDDLFTVLRTTMPKPAVGSLSGQAYLDVLAYVLQRNGLPAGTRALSAQPAALRAVPLAGLAPPKKVAPAFIAGETGTSPSGSGPSQAELNTAPDSSDWLYATRDYAGTRYSPLGQVNRDNVGRLAVACVYQLGSVETFQSAPIVYRGIMYLTTARITAAIDAATCKPRWRYEWAPKDDEVWANNRGVAIKDGYVVRGTADGYLVALDAADGRLLWARQVAHPAEGETITMAPLIYQDLAIIGPAGSENNIQGWIGAFRLSDGEPRWRFNTVPRPGEPGRETWPDPRKIPMGGGAVWTPLSLDVARGELYVGVTNPSPDLPAELRPGKNLYTNAVVALDVRTGTLRWYDQLVPNDAHDWDLTQVSPLIRTTVAGKDRNLLITAGKDGLLHALDRETHERLYETAVTTRLNVDAPITKSGTRFCPGFLGGVEWNGPAYHPGANLLVVPAVDFCMTAKLADTVRHVPGELYLGGTIAVDSVSQGWLTAIDASSGAVRWKYRSPRPMVGAVTTTAGGLVLAGELTGDFLAFDAESGKELYRFYTGAGILGGIVSYAVGGRQHVATVSGGGSFNFGREGAATVVVFTLR